VKPASDAGPLDVYAGIVVGAPLYVGKLLDDGLSFLRRNRDVLEEVPIAVFGLGPLSPDDMDGARGQLSAELAKVPWLTPVATELFVGRYDEAALHLGDKLIAVLPASPLHGVGARDSRDWDAIDAWADSLPAALRIETPAS
jgi:menaquinone-dependent protoporphyrinogen oxidase